MSNMTNRQSDKSGDKGIAWIMGLFVLVVLCVFPVVYHDFYFDILETKYQFFSGAAITMIVMMLVYGLYTNKLIECVKQTSLKKTVKSLNVVDWSVLVFWFAHVVSWLGCEFRWEAFWGTSGRYNGVFLMTIYTVVYFLVTRCFRLKRVYLDAFLAVSIFVCLFGISDYFKMDLLGFKEHMMDEQKSSYTSTFGNINTYTVYVGAVLCVSMVLYVLETCTIRTVIYFAVMALSMVAIIIGESDNAYLTLAALLGLSPLYFFCRKTWIRRYLVCVAVFFSSLLFVDWINVTYKGQVLGLQSISTVITKLSFIPALTKGLWAIVAVWTVIAFLRRGKGNDELGKGLAIAWIFVVAAVIGAAAYVVYDANIAGNAEKYEAIRKYVVYNDAWGSGRGYAWNRSFEIYRDILTPMQKMFGYGADTFALLIIQYFPPEGGTLFDSVHNEYLQFLITTGWVGMGAFAMILASSVFVMAKRVKGRPEVAAMMFMVLAYATQALVNINLPVVFPVIWTLLAMGLCKDSEKVNVEGDNSCKQ